MVVLITLAGVLFLAGVVDSLRIDLRNAIETPAMRCADNGGVYINLPPLEVGCVKASQR